MKHFFENSLFKSNDKLINNYYIYKAKLYNVKTLFRELMILKAKTLFRERKNEKKGTPFSGVPFHLIALLRSIFM